MAENKKIDEAVIGDFVRLGLMELASDDDFAREAFLLAAQNGGVDKLPEVLKQARAEIVKKAQADRAKILKKNAERRARTHELIVLGAVAEKLIGSRDPEALKRHFAGDDT